MCSMSPQLQCPECAAPLAVSEVHGERSYDCAACGAFMCDVTALGELVGVARAQQICAATAEPPVQSARCAFCGNLMHAAAVPQGQAWTCPSCEMVVLDRPARALLAMPPPPAPPAPAARVVGEHHAGEDDADAGKHHESIGEKIEDVVFGGLLSVAGAELEYGAGRTHFGRETEMDRLRQISREEDI